MIFQDLPGFPLIFLQLSCVFTKFQNVLQLPHTSPAFPNSLMVWYGMRGTRSTHGLHGIVWHCMA